MRHSYAGAGATIGPTVTFGYIPAAARPALVRPDDPVRFWGQNGSGRRGQAPGHDRGAGRRRHTRIVISATGQSPVCRAELSCHQRWERSVVGTKIHFMSELAPCGKIVAGDHYADEDNEGLIIRDEYYECGCRRIRHEYHDGSTEVRAIRHDGKLVKGEFGPNHGW